MKKNLKYVLIAVVAILSAGIIWWQFNKKRIVKEQIVKAVTKGTDSTYYIRYDSSIIDAAGGNASFFNIVLQSDSLQKELYNNDTSALPQTIFNVHIGRLNIRGANIPSFLQKNTIEASVIEIIKPVITIISTGKDEKTNFTAEDSLALYEKITGKFKSIQAKEIKITEGTIAFAKGRQSAHNTLMGINITLNNLKIDSTRNYDNIVSYFVKDVVATVDKATLKNDKLNRLFILDRIEYNAPKRLLSVNKILQSELKSGKNLIQLYNNKVTGLSTNAFIINKQIKADSLITNGGEFGIYRKSQSGGGETIEIDNEFFNEALVKNIRIGKTTLTVYNRSTPAEKPLVLKNVRFNAGNIDSINSGTNILKLLGKSKWDFSADGISFLTEDKIYNVNVGPFILDKWKQTVSAKSFSIIPTMSEAAFVKSLKFQKDLFNISVSNIVLEGADLTALLENKKIIGESLSMQPSIKVFNDRTITPDTASKKGKYPHQSIVKLKTSVYIKRVNVKDGYVSYRERGAISKEVGDVFFTKINGVINNVTNIDDYIKKENSMTVDVSTRFLNTALITSRWNMPLNTNNGSFSINGKVGPFDGKKLNPVIEPLGMGSVQSGNIKSYTFNIAGNDYKGEGNGILLYDDLKIKLLKNKDEKIQNKTITSFIANIIIKDQNPSNNNTRTAKISFNRDMTKSFFNLVWKSLFDGAKKSIK